MKILIVGSGQVGYFLCDRLSREGHEVTLVDQDAERIERAQDRLNVLGIVGNGASAETLEQAGIKDADIFIAVTNMDEVNILACLIAREYQVEILVARTKSIEYTSEKAILSKEKLGIDLLINPEDAVAVELTKLSCNSKAFDVAEFAEGQILFQGYRIEEGSPLCDLTLAELGELRGMYRFVVVAINRGDETIIPRGDDTIQAGDRIYIFAPQQEMPAINYMLQSQRENEVASRRAFVLGGSRIGLQVARNLENLQFSDQADRKGRVAMHPPCRTAQQGGCHQCRRPGCPDPDRRRIERSRRLHRRDGKRSDQYPDLPAGPAAQGKKDHGAGQSARADQTGLRSGDRCLYLAAALGRSGDTQVCAAR